MKIPFAINEIEIPEGVKLDIKGNTVKVEGPKGKLERELVHHSIIIKKENSKVIIRCELPKKEEEALVGTFAAHIRNMIKGVTEGFTYKMKVVYAHFPIKVSVKDGEVVIDNFLGEQYPRKVKIFGDTKINVNKDDITIEGINREEVGQTAANIEGAVRVKKRDVRVFQDGIYIVSKGA
ncbi:MAG: 50S ribosomal protein L6 [Candidatus Thermoplasmatota archaeon]|nr:50S ribosomal protein L6 [Candidatus Thermoplasmatota archaeon]